MYKNSTTRQTLFTFPPDEDNESDDRNSSDRTSKKDEDDGFIGKTMSFLAGGGKKVAGGLAKNNRKEEVKKDSEKPPERVFISATSLIKEVKLCVSAQQQAPLDRLAADLAARKITAEQAIPKLQQLVGNTMVQQAAIVVQNLKTGVLPHGWIEYTDQVTKRAYYFNAHTKETTWHTPKQEAHRDSARALEMLEHPDDEEEVGVDYSVTTHEIRLSAEL